MKLRAFIYEAEEGGYWAKVLAIFLELYSEQDERPTESNAVSH